MTRLLRWWRTRPWRGFRADRVDRLNISRLVEESWPAMDQRDARVVGVVMLAVRADGSVRGAQVTVMPSVQEEVWRVAGLAALMQAQGDMEAAPVEKAREVN